MNKPDRHGEGNPRFADELRFPAAVRAQGRRLLNDLVSHGKACGLRTLAVLRMSSATRHIPNRLHSLCRSLTETCERAEPRFMALGEDLQAIYSGMASVTGRIQGSLETFGANSEHSPLQEIQALSQSSFRKMQSGQERIAEKLRQVESMESSLKDLLRGCPEMERIALLLRMVSMNMGIESARIRGAAELFQVVSEDVNQLSREMSDQVTRSQQDLMTSRSAQDEARRGITSGLEDLKTLGAEAKTAVDQAAEESGRIVELSLETLREADRRSSAVSREVGEVVVSLQFHDSMSQRVGHVIEALEDARDLCSRGGNGNGSQHTGVSWGSIHTILRIQGAQLERVAREIHATHGTQKQALAGIEEAVQGLEHMLQDLVNTECRGGDHENPFEGLRSTLQGLKTLLDQGHSLSGHMEEAAEDASQTAARVQECVEGISRVTYRLRIIALNAIVKAAHLDGGGSTLEVLSQEIQRMADVAGTLVDRMNQALKGLLTGADDLREGSGDTDSRAAGSFQRNMDAGMDAVARAWTAFQEESKQALDQSSYLRVRLRDMQEQLDFLPQLAERFLGQRAELQDAEEALAPWSETETGHGEDHAARLAERYTMEMERDTHQEILLGATSAPGVEGDVSPSLDGSDSDAPGDDTDPQGETPQEENNLGDNVELF